MQIALYSCPILMKFEISRQFFEKYSNGKFHLLHKYIYASMKKVSLAKKK